MEVDSRVCPQWDLRFALEVLDTDVVLPTQAGNHAILSLYFVLASSSGVFRVEFRGRCSVITRRKGVRLMRGDAKVETRMRDSVSLPMAANL
jgi:hypothetical protein